MNEIYIGGQWLPGSAGHFEVEDPSSREVIAHVANGDARDAVAAVDAAAAAFPHWRQTPPRQRSEILHRVFDLMVRDSAMLATLISRENGKALDDAKAEVIYAAEFFRWYAEECVRSGGEYGISPTGGTRTIVTHQPLGVAALVTPWNFPAAMAARKVAPALAAGCTVVLKPASETPLTAVAIARLLVEAGVPNGVFNLVPTIDASSVVTAWMEDSRVRKISFTGSTNTGKILLKQAANRVVNSSMELGGNAPLIVLGDADIDAAVAGTMIAKFRGGGQACTAANRIYVHADVVDEFTEKLGSAVEALTVGPASDGSRIGPLISGKAVETIEDLVSSALDCGARITHQATLPHSKGFYYPPTVLRDVPSDAEIVSTEIFGPVAPIVTWENEADMLRSVNASEFGLAAYVFCGDLQHAMRMAEAIDAGMVGINRGLVSDPSAPFGGVKQSGLGREGARVGLEEFTETQYISIDWPTATASGAI